MAKAQQYLTLKSLDTEPIERVEESGDTVRFKNLKFLSPGVWSDAGSQTATYYPPEGIANLEAHYNESEYSGPPVNIMHSRRVRRAGDGVVRPHRECIQSAR